MRRLLLVPLVFLILGCNNWERDTYNTLAASVAILNTVQNDYDNKTIPQTQCAYTLINDGKAAQTTAVNAMVVYEQYKTTNKGSLQSQQAAVSSDLATLAPLVTQISALIANPAAACGGKS